MDEKIIKARKLLEEKVRTVDVGTHVHSHVADIVSCYITQVEETLGPIDEVDDDGELWYDEVRQDMVDILSERINKWLTEINSEPVQKVWVLHRECVIDYELSSREIKVFRSEGEARKEFKEKAKHDRKYCCTSEWEVGTDDENNFDAYEDGYYAQNHIMIELEETVIN